MREQGGHLEGLARTPLLSQWALCLPRPTSVGQLVELETRGRERGDTEKGEGERALASQGEAERHWSQTNSFESGKKHQRNLLFNEGSIL